jgi:hypothetical protein
VRTAGGRRGRRPDTSALGLALPEAVGEVEFAAHDMLSGETFAWAARSSGSTPR